MYRYTTLLMLCVAMTIGARDPQAAGAAGATLRKISSRMDARAGVIAIEASDPVPYIASQPDPREFVVELRDIVAVGFADNFKPDPRHPFASMQVEAATGADGASVARVKMTLAQPVRPRVRSSRNMIYVEADRLDRPSSASKAMGASISSSAIRDVRVARRGTATAVTLHSTGRLVVSGVEDSKEGPPKLYIDLANATSAIPGLTPIGAGPVDAVRVGLNINNPLVMRVTMDLTREAPYRFESSDTGNDLTVIFDEVATTTDAATSAGRVPVMQAAPVPSPSPAVPVLAAPPPSLAPPVMAAQGAQVPPQVPAPAAAPAQPAPPAQGAAGAPQQPIGPPQRFTGFPVSLDFQGADLRAVLRTFAEISGLNIVIDPTIQGTVDVALRDVPWDQALDIILRANRLGYVIDGTIVRIAPLTVLADEEAQRQKLAEAQALAGTLTTITRTLSYARAELVQPMLTATVLSQRGSITTDVRTNTLIITDLEERLTRAADLLAKLDQPQPQVEIEARIVTTTRDFARELGVQWGVQGRAVSELGNNLPLTFPNQVTIDGRTQAPAQGAEGVVPTVNLPATTIDPPTSVIGLALGAVNGAFNLDVALSALERNGNGRILSTPRVTTQNNIAAMIEQGIQIPIQTVANNTVTVTFRPATLRLNVTPQITAANTVIMAITVANESPDFTRAVNGIPPIDSQNANTQVLVNNGETTVIGGIYVSREQAQAGRTPGLYRLPLLGWLFQRNSITDESRELLIFITPRIIRL